MAALLISGSAVHSSPSLTNNLIISRCYQFSTAPGCSLLVTEEVMKRNPLLRSILFAFVCLLVAGEISRDRFAMAQGSATEGSLVALDGSGKPAGACPLKHTAVKTEISGSLARVMVTQQFENPFPDKIEAVYTFPLPPAAAVPRARRFGLPQRPSACRSRRAW